MADRLARFLIGSSFDGSPSDQVELVQFHQSYGYEDFVQGIRPITDADGHIQYRVLPGIFTRFCRVAAENPDKPFVLIIDEINRGNLSRIFGELLLLLEYRDRRVRLPYGAASEHEADAYLTIPDNLRLIGTMNTADRSLAQIDYALRRRFYFHRLLPLDGHNAPVLRSWLATQPIEPARAAQVHGLFVALNQKIAADLGPDFQVGHSYFMRDDIGEEAGLDRVWRRAVLPLIEEYVSGARDHAETMAGYSRALLTPALTSLTTVVTETDISMTPDDTPPTLDAPRTEDAR